MTPTAPLPNLTALPLPQLAALLRAQFSPSQRQELVELLEEKPVAAEEEESESVLDSLRQALLEVKQYQRGELKFRPIEELLDELRNSSHA